MMTETHRYHEPMTSAHPASSPVASGVTQFAAAGWLTLQRSAALLALALSPSAHVSAVRLAVAREVVQGVAPALVWFALVAALVSLVITRIVVATAESYGLGPYALGVLIRVLVLELIPLGAAAFVAMRYTLPQGAALAAAQERGPLPGLAAEAPMQFALLPRALAGMWGVWTAAVLAVVIALVQAYVYLHGLSPWAWSGYTRQVGQVLDGATLLIFFLKTLGFGLVVSLVPMATCLRPPRRPGAALSMAAAASNSATADGGSPELRSLMRVGVLLLALEVLALVVNYA